MKHHHEPLQPEAPSVLHRRARCCGDFDYNRRVWKKLPQHDPFRTGQATAYARSLAVAPSFRRKPDLAAQSRWRARAGGVDGRRSARGCARGCRRDCRVRAERRRAIDHHPTQRAQSRTTVAGAAVCGRRPVVEPGRGTALRGCAGQCRSAWRRRRCKKETECMARPASRSGGPGGCAGARSAGAAADARTRDRHRTARRGLSAARRPAG